MFENNDKKQQYQVHVARKYQLYNKLFLTLPFEKLPEVGVKLAEFTQHCHDEIQQEKNPGEIIQSFFKKYDHKLSFEEQEEILLLFTQFVERQVLLFDALEDGAFSQIHNTTGEGTLSDLTRRLIADENLSQACTLLPEYTIRIVLTAHPTQFYPPQVLGIIPELAVATQQDDLKAISDLLLQLGLTSFHSQQKPSPYDEATTLMEYLEQVFYPVIKDLHYHLTQSFCGERPTLSHMPAPITLGFWPGGDRDGNPEVNTKTTAQVAQQLRYRVIELYKNDIKVLQSKLTFPHCWEKLANVHARLSAAQHEVEHYEGYLDASEFIIDLNVIRQTVVEDYQGLFVDEIDALLSAAKSFGFYFASVDVRQDSSVHEKVMQACLDHLKQQHIFDFDIANVDKFDLYLKLLNLPRPQLVEAFLESDPLIFDVLDSLRLIDDVQTQNGEQGMHRYVISNTQYAYHILEVMVFAHWAGWSVSSLRLDVVPLFETIDDLNNAENIMRDLFECEIYRAHLKNRHDQQIIMLGFSDGTKDGGYFTANWSIFKAKKRLAALAARYDIRAIFFDGRGGPPARGGGNTHKFYQAMESMIPQHQIQLTVQGQTISSKFGTIDSARYNVEQLFTSRIGVKLFPQPDEALTDDDISLLEHLSEVSYAAYIKLKEHPKFVRYLEEVTTLNYYGELNIASRPPRRASETMQFSDLRAIPFVCAWSQMKQNVPGYYGLGTAIKRLCDDGCETKLKTLYQHSLFFRTLIENAMQSLAKSNFAITQYLQHDPEFGEFWELLRDEAVLTKSMLLNISGQEILLQDDPINRQSIALREELVFPLLIIQQAALMGMRAAKAQQLDESDKRVYLYHKLILKSLAAIVNASRNSA